MGQIAKFQLAAAANVATVMVIGEIDLSVCDELQSVVDDALAQYPTVLVDLAECTYMDSSGLRVLIGAVGAATKAGRSVTAVHPTPEVRRVMALADVAEILMGSDAS